MTLALVSQADTNTGVPAATTITVPMSGVSAGDLIVVSVTGIESGDPADPDSAVTFNAAPGGTILVSPQSTTYPRTRTYVWVAAGGETSKTITVTTGSGKLFGTSWVLSGWDGRTIGTSHRDTWSSGGNQVLQNGPAVHSLGIFDGTFQPFVAVGHANEAVPGSPAVTWTQDWNVTGTEQSLTWSYVDGLGTTHNELVKYRSGYEPPAERLVEGTEPGYTYSITGGPDGAGNQGGSRFVFFFDYDPGGEAEQDHWSWASG